MKITRIIIGIAASLVLPLAGAIAGAASDPSVKGTSQHKSASHAYDYGRDSHGKSSQNSKNGKGKGSSKGGGKGGKGGKGSKGSKGSGKGSHGSNGGHGSKSPCKPKRGG